MRFGQPIAHQRRHARLHDGDAEAGRDARPRRASRRRRRRRAAPPATAAIIMPSVTASLAPIRAIRSDPGTAAMANSASGSPIRSPIWVSDIRSSSWMSGITGGTTNSVMRMATPASQSRHKNRRVASQCCGGFSPGGRHACSGFPECTLHQHAALCKKSRWREALPVMALARLCLRATLCLRLRQNKDRTRPNAKSAPNVRSRRRAAEPSTIFGFAAFRPGSGRNRLRHPGRPRRARGHADRQRQVALLSASGAGARRAHRRGVAADRADAQSGGATLRQRHRGGELELGKRSGGEPRHPRADRARRIASRLCRA